MSSRQTRQRGGRRGLDCSAGAIPPLTESVPPRSSFPGALRVGPGVSDTWSLGCCPAQPARGPAGWPGETTHTARVAVTAVCLVCVWGQIKATRPACCVFLEASLGLTGNVERSRPAASGLAVA